MITMTTIDGRKLSDAEQDQHTLGVRVITGIFFARWAFRSVSAALRRRSAGRADRGDPQRGRCPSVVARLPDPLGHRSARSGQGLGQEGEALGGTVVGVVADVRDFGPRVDG